ncbi:MAG: hypothetical protein NTU44_03330 [Bacteroidetes bacterium]|nr:hypothetical protein [Bacteroidota bacterium]
MTSVRAGILLILFTLCLFSPGLFAQFFDTGQDPASIKWRKIQTEHFKVICPADFEKEGQKIAGLLEFSLPRVSSTLDHHLRGRFPVLVHSRSAISNGLVSWAPRRMELYPVPPQGNYPQDWFEQLAVHEGRHVIQLDRLNTGTVRAMNLFFGQSITALTAGLYVPSWFMEGDAVVAETALSNSGRGRVPDFEMELRAQTLLNGIFSYDKAVFGSYRDYIPDRYILGYHLVAWGRKQYGRDLWVGVLGKVSRNPFIPNPFNRGIREKTGLSLGSFYKRGMKEMDSLWQNEDNKLTLSTIKNIPVRDNGHYTDYHFPAEMEGGCFFSTQTGIDIVPRFIKIDPDGNESVLYIPGDIGQDAISYNNGKIFWAEYEPDIRWENRNYSVVKVFDIASRKTTTLGRKTRWFSPSPSPDNTKICAVEVDEGGVCSLVILEATRGALIRRIKTAENLLLLTPAWDGEGKHIICAVQGEKGKALADINAVTGKIIFLTRFTTVEISGPVYYQDKVIFLGGWNGIDNVYSLDTAGGQILQLTSSRFGAHDPSVTADGQHLLYVDYTPNGHRITEAELPDLLNISLESIDKMSLGLDTLLSQQEGGPIQYPELQPVYPSKPYRKLFHLFDFHSWAPAYLDISGLGVSPGITLMSQNLLSTMFMTAGYLYNQAEQTGKYTLDITYKGFYPVLSLSCSDGLRASEWKSGRYTWEEKEIKAGISLPLNFSRNRYYRGLQPAIKTTVTELLHTSSTPGIFYLPAFKSLEYELYAYQLLRYTTKNLLPEWGQVVYLRFRNSPFGGENTGTIKGVQSTLYFPGLYRHHSFSIDLGFQYRINGMNYRFADVINLPRSYSISTMKTTGTRFGSATVQYALPLFYPDLSLPRVAYVKRISAFFFIDHAFSYSGNSLSHYEGYTCFGADLLTDLHLFRFYAPFRLGLRTMYLPEKNTYNLEFLYQVNLNSF